jgi:hypothetical protein
VKCAARAEINISNTAVSDVQVMVNPAPNHARIDVTIGCEQDSRSGFQFRYATQLF